MQEGVLQLVGVLILIISIVTMFSIIGHINRSKQHNEEVIKLLKEIKENMK